MGFFSRKKSVSAETVKVEHGGVPTNLIIDSERGIYGTDDDESPITYENIFTLLKSDSTVFNEVNDVAYLASRDFKVVSQDWDEEQNEGVKAIQGWMKEYNTYPKLQKYIEEMVRDRAYGLSCGELVDITNPIINGGNPILFDFVTISPHTIDVYQMERDRLGNLTRFVQSPTEQGQVIWEGDECDNLQIVKWNQNDYSKIGLSHLVPSYTDIKNFKDLRLYILEIFKKDARPIVEHTLDSEDLSDKQVKAYFSKYQNMLNTIRSKKMTEIFKTEKWTTEIKGFQGKMLDYSSIVNKLDIQRREALRYPNMASGEGTNKATMEVQRAAWNQTKIAIVDRIVRRDIVEPIFRKVLIQLGMPDAPCPTIQQDALASLDKLVDAQADAYYAEILGPQYASLVAERVGIRDYDADWKQKAAEAQMNMKSNMLGQDGFSKGKENRTGKTMGEEKDE